MKRPNRTGLTATALLILALGFGILGAALAVGKAVLWDELPFRDSGRLAVLTGLLEEKGEIQTWGISHLDFLDWRRQNRGFDEMSVFTGTGGVAYNLLTPEGSERLAGELVSHTYFRTLGIEPAVGRFFTAQEDEEPFVHPVTVLSYELWQRRFGGAPAIVGRKVNLSGKDWQVVGVGPKGFRGLTDTAQLWVPSSMVPGPEFLEVRRFRWLNVVARLKPDVTPQQAQEDLDRIAGALARQYPDQNRGIGVKVQPLHQFIYDPALAGGLRPVVWGAAAVLLLALIHAASLLRVRASVGLSVAISIGAAVLGLLLATWAIQVLLPTSGFKFPGFARLTPGPALVAGLLALALACGAAVAALAQWRAVRVLAGIAAAAQVILAVLLLARTGMMGRELRQVTSQDLGYNPKNLLTLRVDLTAPQYADNKDVARIAGQYLRRLEKLPEVASVAITGPTIATDDWVGGFTTAEDHDNPESDDGTYKVLTHGVSPDYFKVMEIPIVQGRAFNWQDTQGYHVILSEGMARQIWPGRTPLGERIKFSARALPRPWLTVVGVAADTQYQGYHHEKRPAPDFYLSVLQQPVRMPMILNVLARPKPGISMQSLEAAIRRGVLAVTADTPLYDVATLDARLEKQTWKARFPVRVAGLFSAVTLVLAVAGVYGILAARRAERTVATELAAGQSPASQRQAAH